MADFAIRNLAVMSFAGGVTLWVYRHTAGSMTDVQAPGFFAPASDLIATGDFILVSCGNGALHLWVASARDGAVDARVMAKTVGDF